MISIIIPTLNEEKFLPLLLDSIKKQTFRDYEIIVADAGSTDRTVEIAKLYNCKITKGGLPARGRNEGSKVARGEILFFLDADALLFPDFLEKAIEEFQKRNLDVASFCLKPFPFRNFSSFCLNTFYNTPIKLLENVLPHGASGILIKRELFERIGRFDETVKFAEDHEMIRRAWKKENVKFGIIKSVPLLTSDRRFRRDGWLRVGLKCLLCELHLIFLGPVKSDIFKYRFGHYRDQDIRQV